MKRIIFLSALLWAASASAADSSLPVRALAATPTKTGQLNVRRMTSPTISVTRVTRHADGSLAMDCAQKPNPKLLTERASNGKPTGAKQP